MVETTDGFGDLRGRVKVGENIPSGGRRACGDMEVNGMWGGGAASLWIIARGGLRIEAEAKARKRFLIEGLKFGLLS